MSSRTSVRPMARLVALILSLGLLPLAAPWATRAADPALAPDWTFTAVSSGQDHTCAIRTDGTLGCWGSDWSGQASPPKGTFTAVSTGWDHTCAIRTDGTLGCWGSDGYGQAAPPEGTFAAVSAGYRHTCAIRADGALACWGDNGSGQATPPAGTFAAVSAGGSYSCAIRIRGALACWGSNAEGRAAPPKGRFSAVTAGIIHSCGVRTHGDVACWGSNYYGQATPPEGSFTAVSAGGSHTCAIRTDGTLACWGDNGSGEATPPAGTFAAVSAGGSHTCAIRSDGALSCWGTGGYPRPASVTAASPRWVARTAVAVTWGAVPVVAPIASYDVRYQRLRWNDSWYDEGNWLTATTATSGKFTGIPGSTYCFDVRARDTAGNVSEWMNEGDDADWPDFNEAACTSIPLDERSLARSAGWTALSDSRFYRSTGLRTTRYGATLTRTNVSSDRLRLVATTCPTCGTVKVYINSRLKRTISLYSATRIDRAILPIGSAFLWGDTVKIKVASSGKKVIIDGLAIYRTWID